MQAQRAHLSTSSRMQRLTHVLLVTLFVCAINWRQHVPATAQDIALEQRVDALMARMTLEQKVGQLFLVFFVGDALSDSLLRSVREFHVGGVVLFQGNIDNGRQTAALINAIQREALASSAGVPLFVGVDQEGGIITRLPPPATLFPAQMALGAIGDDDLAARVATAQAQQLKALGFNLNLAPVLDVNDNPDNPVIGTRAFGSDPAMVAALGVSMLRAYRAAGILSVAKHYPGHGSTSVDSHSGLPIVNKPAELLESVELLPFKQAIWTGAADAIMTAHVAYPALDDSKLPATLSSKFLTGILRERLGFRGLIVSDSMTMDAIDRRFPSGQAAVLAFRAGVDIIAIGGDLGATAAAARADYQALLKAIQEDPALQTRLDESVRRILRAKASYGVLDWTPTDELTADAALAQADHVAIAREVAQRSLTLVRDDDDQLPIKPGDTLALIAPRETDRVGFYTLDALVAPLRACHPGLTVLDVALQPNAREIARVSAEATKFNKVVAVTINARFYAQQAALLRALNAPIVAAIRNPYDLLNARNAPAFLTTYSDVPASLEALARALCGEIGTPGRLAVTVAPEMLERVIATPVPTRAPVVIVRRPTARPPARPRPPAPAAPVPPADPATLPVPP